MAKHIVFLLAILTGMPAPGKSQFAIDQSFGSGGTTTMAGTQRADRLFISSSGKILAVGSIGISAMDDRVQVARFNPSGDPDSTFGQGGLVTTPSNFMGHLRDAEMLPDEKLIVAGNYFHQSGTGGFVGRLNADGSPDVTFTATGHKPMISIASYTNFNVKAVLAMPNGGILVGAEAYTNDSSALIVQKFNTNSSPDLSFGQGSIKTFTAAYGSVLGDLALDPDGNILMAAAAQHDSSGAKTTIIRLKPNGVPDQLFGINGVSSFDLRVTVNGTFMDEEGWRIIVQPDKKILVLSLSDSAKFIRLMPNGSLDTGFGNSGKISVTGFYPQDFVIDADSGITACGSEQTGQWLDAVLLRLLPNGQPDAAYGTNGISKHPLGWSAGYLGAMAQQADGKIVAGGAVALTGSAMMAAVRFHNNMAGLDENNTGEAYTVSPNPFTDHAVLRLNGSGSTTVRITDLSGRTVGRSSFEGSIFRIPRNDLPSGVYILEIGRPGKTSRTKLIAQ